MSEKQEFSQIQLSVAENIATITLDRPEKLNAFTNKMLHEIIAAFDLTDADDSVRAVIVTGAGRAFCAGADLSSGGETFSRAAVMCKVCVEYREMVVVSSRCEYSIVKNP